VEADIGANNNVEAASIGPHTAAGARRGLADGRPYGRDCGLGSLRRPKARPRWDRHALPTASRSSWTARAHRSRGWCFLHRNAR